MFWDRCGERTFGYSASQSQWQSLEQVDPFFCFRNMPDQNDFVDDLRYRHRPRNEDQTRTIRAGDELSEVLRHRTHVVRDQNTAE